MRPRPSVAIALFLMVALAGCTDAPTETEPPKEDPILHTSPDDPGTGDDAGRSHLHDYWNGQKDLLVFDATFPGACTCGAGAPLFRYEPPAEAVFPQGTRWVNVTVEWTDDEKSSYGETTFWLETAADREPVEIGPVTSGDTLTFEVTNNTQNDLPHEILSNWAFEVRVETTTPRPVGLWHFEGEIHIVATAARGLEIPLFPPHPDRWNGTTEIVLFEDEDAGPVYYGSPEGGQAGNSWLGPHGPDDGKVVPHDMGHVVVEVTYEETAPITFTLAFHGSEGRDWTLIEADSTEGRTSRYIITPDEGRPDGPYVQQSSWVFEIFTEEDRPVFVGGYTIRATVFKGPPA